MKNWKLGDRIETRFAYGEGLLELGRRRQDVIVLDADLQRSNQTYAYGQEHPGYFYDLGIAEADMISTAAGMAAMNYTVFATSFAMFLPGRCYDQIRLQVAYAKSDVKLAGVSAGLTQGPDGASHQSFDDVGLMRQLPGMTVIVPADAEEAYQAVIAAAEMKGPVYLRFGRYPTPVIFDETYHFESGKAKVLRDGGEIAMFATGIMVAIALESATKLAEAGIQAAVVDIATIKPLDREAIERHASGKKLVVSLEEHSVLNGLGSAVAEALTEIPSPPNLLRIGMDDSFGQSGKANELLEHYNLSAPKVVGRVQDKLDSIPLLIHDRSN
jgi:transketolase